MAGRREQTPPIFLVEGEARRRGGGIIQAAARPEPKYDWLEGYAALGGVSTIGSPRSEQGRSLKAMIVGIKCP